MAVSLGNLDLSYARDLNSIGFSQGLRLSINATHLNVTLYFSLWTHRCLDLLELFLGCSQRDELVRALHLDRGRVWRGPFGYPLQHETKQTIREMRITHKRGLFDLKSLLGWRVFLFSDSAATSVVAFRRKDGWLVLWTEKNQKVPFSTTTLFQQIWVTNKLQKSKNFAVSWCSGSKLLGERISRKKPDQVKPDETTKF